MVDILHRVGIVTSSPEEVYHALSTREGLAAWWTEDTQGVSEVGNVLQFRFPEGGFDMRVNALDAAGVIRWDVIDGPAEWIGTTVTFRLTRDGDYTVVLFEHQGWREPVEFMYHCSTKWGVFLLSLKSLIETGEGAPSPRDLKIDNWN